MASAFEETIAADQRNAVEQRAQGLLGCLIQAKQYVGEVYSLGYESALVLIHDYYRRQVGGIPSLSFLIATRLAPKGSLTYQDEDASVLLLRVMDAGALPNDMEALRVRVENAQRVSGETEHWDSSKVMDADRAHLLSYAGVRCRVLGTFFLDRTPNSPSEEDLLLKFGCDISNYYPNQGLKVYKPNSEALAQIVNFRDPERIDPQVRSVRIGHMYCTPKPGHDLSVSYQYALWTD